MESLWESHFAQRTKRMSSSVIRELLKLTERPDVISFAGGLPAPDVFPLEEIRDATQRVLQYQSSKALQYGTTEGFLPLREWIACRTSHNGFRITPENVLITSGSQQALDLVGKVFFDPGDKVLVESPTYLGALQAWNAYEAEYVTVPSDHDGMMTHLLGERLHTNPKFIYVLPNYQNPTGVTLSLERRKQLIEFAAANNIPIVEDDPYGQLCYEGECLPSVLELAAKYQNVIYMSTFSKILAPGFRLAWVIGPREVIQRLVQAKQGADLHSSTLTQMIAYEVAKDGFLDEHIQLIRRVYHTRRNAMLEAMRANFPASVTWTHPKGGLFLWVTLPQGVDAAELLPEAVERKVAFVPGGPFHPDGTGKNTMRLNFSNATLEQIEIGIARLGKLFASKFP